MHNKIQKYLKNDECRLRAMAKYKQKCVRCKDNYVLVSSWRDRSPTCYDCQKDELQKPIVDKEMKEFFEIPDEFYEKSSFLRNIRVNYTRYKKISDKQRDAFLKAVEDMKKVLNQE